MDAEHLARAARAVEQAEAIVVGAGAGMGVDSGLPDFRGNEGFWNAYPPYRELGFSFVDMANPAGFRRDPALAWGFYGHRRALYRATVPHEGFAILGRWIAQTPAGGAVFTSNVDGQFQVAGFEVPVYECHGTIHVDQCLAGCGRSPWEADATEVAVDPATMRAVGPLPRCPSCDGLARPNILMFGDWGWDGRLAQEQADRLSTWLDEVRGARLVVVEVGAGTAVPSVRRFCEDTARARGATLVRINPREADAPPGQVSLASGARSALQAIDGARR